MSANELPVLAEGVFAGLPEVEACRVDFSRFYDVCFSPVYGFLRAQVSDATVAEELAARAFLKAYQHRLKLPAGEAALFWALRIARNTLIDYFRVEGRRVCVSIPIQEIAAPPRVAGDPEAIYAEKQRNAFLLRVMNKMDRASTELLVFKFVSQRTNREIAVILGISEAAVSMRLIRVLRAMRSQLEEMGCR